jgi:phosphoglycolate phosphatase-like HAD superfamily hydrolase
MSEKLVNELRTLRPKHPYFIGVDSDGCVFDTMEIKQKECFIPCIIKHFNLHGVSTYLRESAEFVNLYSSWRGANRFPAIIKTFDFLRERPEVKKRAVAVPSLNSLRKWIEEETKLGNPALQAKVEAEEDPELRQVLEWSLAVNTAIKEMVKGIGPFPYVREGLEKAARRADLIVVSQTPSEALEREWKEHDLDGYVRVIAGQEYGTKAEHLQYAASGKYPADKVLMIGDALGDLQAAETNNVLFYPVNPGREEESWQRFYEEALDKFLEGSYQGTYEKGLIEEFKGLLPSVPPWIAQVPGTFEVPGT